MKDRIESLIEQITNWQIMSQGQERDFGLMPGEVVSTARNLRAVLDGLLDGDPEIPIVLSNLSAFKLYQDLPSEAVRVTGGLLREKVYSAEVVVDNDGQSHPILGGGMHN